MCLLYIAICFGVERVQAQSCFVQLGDATGMNISDYEDELEAAACALIDAFPEEYQDSFKVFDFGFYTLQALYENDLSELFLAQVNFISLESKYYVIFGRQLSYDGRYENIFLDLKLPSGNFFECVSLSQVEVIKNKLEIILRAKTLTSMEKAINHLQIEVVKMDSCCIPSLISSCSSCLSQSDINILLQGKGFEQFTTIIYESSNGGQYSSRSISPVIGDNGWVIDIDGEEVNLYNEMIYYSQLLSGMNLDFEGYITSDVNTCSSQFIAIDSQFNNSTAQNKLWWHVSEDSGGNSSFLFEYKRLDGLYEYIGADLLDHISGLESEDYGECKGTGRFQMPKANFTNGDFDSPAIIKEEGHAAHWIIQTFYSASYLLHNIELEYQIPKSSELKNAGYADIVNLSTREIFEIKTVKGRIKGVEEVKRYVDNANIYCKPAPSLLSFSRGKSFPLNGQELPWINQFKKLTVWQDLKLTPDGGVITYNLVPRNPNKDPSPVLVPVPENTWEDLYELLKQMAFNMNNAAGTALNYLKDHPEQVVLMAAAAVIVIAICKTGLAASGGTASPLLVPMIICAGVLLKVCYDFEPPSPGP